MCLAIFQTAFSTFLLQIMSRCRGKLTLHKQFTDI